MWKTLLFLTQIKRKAALKVACLPTLFHCYGNGSLMEITSSRVMGHKEN